MSSTISGKPARPGLVLAFGAALTSSFAASPARAGDDGSAPIWIGFGNVLGMVKNDDDATIEYREHGKLVLPPKFVLPPPGTAAIQPGPAWPVDPDVKRAKKAKHDEAALTPIKAGRPGETPLVPAGVPVTMSATAGDGPGPAPCVRVDPKTGECPQKPEAKWNYNPLTWVGLAKKPPVVLGPEPYRENLTDPPAGYRAPVEGVGAIADGN
jgi:hypothetical protein